MLNAGQKQNEGAIKKNNLLNIYKENKFIFIIIYVFL
jgi:hypothetical protein